MREIRQSGSEGGGTKSIASPYPYLSYVRYADAHQEAVTRTAHCTRRASSLIFQYRFSVYRDLDDVANDDAALIHRVVPTDAKVLPIDRSFGDEAGAGLWAFVDVVFPPGCLPLTEVANVEDSRSRDPANR